MLFIMEELSLPAILNEDCDLGCWSYNELDLVGFAIIVFC